MRAVDLGCGPGAVATRLQALGCSVLAVDVFSEGYEASTPHISLDLNGTDFSSVLGLGSFDLVTAVEVIEHLESPIGFLRNVARLLSPSGVAVITTPNVDCLPARLKFLLSGTIRTMDENSDPTHRSPIFIDLLERQFLCRCNLEILERLAFPEKGFQLSRKPVARVLGILASALQGRAMLGDHHVLVLGSVR